MERGDGSMWVKVLGPGRTHKQNVCHIQKMNDEYIRSATRL